MKKPKMKKRQRKRRKMDNRQLIMKMTEYYSGRPGQIQHFMKVYAYARLIGEVEHLSFFCIFLQCCLKITLRRL